MRLINADKLSVFIEKERAGSPDTYKQNPIYVNGKYDAYCKTLDIIKEQPTIDAEPVVRCKDCKHREYIAGRMFCGKVYSLRVEENHFCSYGAKMDEDKCEI